MPKVPKAVIDSHLRIPLSEVKPYDEVISRLTLYPKYEGKPIELFDLSHPGWFGYPLYHFDDYNTIAEQLEDQRTFGSCVNFKFLSTYRAGQASIMKKFDKAIVQGYRGFLLESPAASGKTIMIISMLQKLGRTALVVVPRSTLVKQWIKKITEHSDLEKKDIGYVLGRDASWKGKKIVVGLVHSLALDGLPPEFKRNFGVVAFDEVDRSVPPATFAPVVGMFPSAYRIGATATVKRQDGMEEVFKQHIGQYFLTADASEKMEAKVIFHAYKYSSGNIWKGSAKLNRRGMLISKLANNPNRNKLIAEYIMALYKSGRKVAVLSDRTAQLVALQGILTNGLGVSADDIAYYARQISVNGKIKNLNQEYLNRAINCKILLCTYGLFAIGTDIPDLAGLVLATPQSQITQTKGRAERIFPGKKKPLVIDIKDTAYQDTRRWAANRMRQYRKERLDIKEVS